MENIGIEKAWNHVTKRLLHEKTNLIYDSILKDSDFPTPEETRVSYPNPCGYGTGMEDSMISAGTMLDACLILWETQKSPEAEKISHRIVDGMIRCADSAYTEGFLPRSVTPIDGKSHYINSSRDQYTLFVFGAHRYINSDICTDEEKKNLSRILEGFAKRAEKNITQENNYDMLRDDGGKSHVTAFWGESLENHEYLRLPMIYLAAWEASENEHWLEAYRKIRTEAYEKSLPMSSYWHLYALQQMQVSVRLCYDADPDEGWKEKYGFLLNEVADYALGMVPEISKEISERCDVNVPSQCFRDRELKENIYLKKLGLYYLTPVHKDADTFFFMQDAANIAITVGLSPDIKLTKEAAELFKNSYKKIDFEKHTRALSVHFLQGYYRAFV